MSRNLPRAQRALASIHQRPEDVRIIRQELHAGTIRTTCTKLVEAEVLAEASVRDILIANQIVGSIKLQRLMALLGARSSAICTTVRITIWISRAP